MCNPCLFSFVTSRWDYGGGIAGWAWRTPTLYSWLFSDSLHGWKTLHDTMFLLLQICISLYVFVLRRQLACCFSCCTLLQSNAQRVAGVHGMVSVAGTASMFLCRDCDLSVLHFMSCSAGCQQWVSRGRAVSVHLLELNPPTLGVQGLTQFPPLMWSYERWGTLVPHLFFSPLGQMHELWLSFWLEFSKALAQAWSEAYGWSIAVEQSKYTIFRGTKHVLGCWNDIFGFFK